MNVGDSQLWRHRLSALVFSSHHPTIIAAPPGFGASILAAYLASAEHDAPAAVIDFHHVDPERLAIGTLKQKHVVFVGRDLPALGQLHDAQLIDHSLLRLTETEAIEIADYHSIDPKLARTIHLFTAGWPDYFTSCLRAVQSADDAMSRAIAPDDVYDRLQKGPHVHSLIAACTSELEPSDLAHIAQLTHFAKISPGLINALLGSGGLQRVQRAGLPIVETDPGWYEVLEPVLSTLRSTATLDEQTARRIAPELIADAGMVSGAQILISAGQPAAAAEALRAIPLYELDEGSQPRLLSLLRTVLDSEKDDGSLRLRLARVQHNHGDLVSFRRTLEETVVAASEQLRPDLEVEAKAELLLLDVNLGNHALVRQRLNVLIEQAREHANAPTRIRLREVAIMLESESDALNEIYSSAKNLESVANDWELIGELTRAAASLRLLATRPLIHLGTHAKAIAVLERACDLSKRQPQGHLKSLTVLERHHALLHDLDGFATVSKRVAEVAPNSELQWIEAYHTWSKMIISGATQDQEAVRLLHVRTESLLMKELLDHETGVVFFADSAIAFAYAGDHDRAAEMLARAAARRSESLLEVGCAEVLVHACRGDSKSQQILNELRAMVPVPAEREWRLQLAVRIAEGVDDVTSLLAEARHYDLEPLYHSTVKCVSCSNTPRPIRLKLLGDFRVFDGDHVIKISNGKATELVKFLGVRMKPVPTDVVIDHLWGNVPTDVGLRRLKNVVARARSTLSQESIERRGQTIELGSHVTSDLTDVRDLLRQLRTQPNNIGAAIQVVDLYRGPLLELDVYHDWVSTERQSVDAAVLSALEVVIDADGAPAAWALDALARLDPDDDRPYMAVADLASRQDDGASLQVALSHVERICADLDVALPTGYNRMAGRIVVLLASPNSVSRFKGA